MFGKSELTEYLNFLQENDPNLFLDRKHGFFLKIDKANRRMITDDYLSVVWNSMFHDNCKLAYGKPSDIIIF